MKLYAGKKSKLAVAISALLVTGVIFTYAATTVIVAVGTIPNSELFDGPATVTVRQLVIAPGETLAWHYHPGRAYNVIKRGTLTVEDGCGLTEQFVAGQAFEETEFHVHRAKNLGSEDVEVYNTFIVPEGQPTTINMPNNERRCGPLVPTLTLDSPNFCPAASWTLKVAHGFPSSPVHLIGADGGRPWRVPDWGRTDASGNLTIGGTFAEGALGSHTLRVEIGGLLSNPVDFTVSRCTP